MGRESILRERVNRLRELLQEADTATSTAPARPAVVHPATAEADSWRRFQAYAANDPLPAADDSEEAIAIRTINRVAVTYGWTGEIQRYLDNARAGSLSLLTSTQLAQLSRHMLHLEDCAQHGFSPPDSPPAF